MAITDLWGNSLNGITTDVLGYRGEFTEFPHDLYSFVSSSIRDDDQKNVSLIYRWLLASQSYWEAQYNTILGSFSLLSPEDCPEDYLDYLKYNVGLHKGLDYIWGTMTENEKRTFIKNYTDFIKLRYSDGGIKLILEKLTKEFVYTRDFFYYRWIISGDSDNETETQIGRDDDGYDPWLLGDENYTTGQKPDAIDNATASYYQFDISTMINNFPYNDIPTHVYVRCLATGQSQRGEIVIRGGDYVVIYNSYVFGQNTDILSDDINQFRVSFESDPYISDILITDRDGTLNRDMVEALVKYNRPISERFYIRYYKWIDHFNYDDFWEQIFPFGPGGSLTHDSTNNTLTLTAGAVGADSLVDITGADDWTDYEYTIKLRSLYRGMSLGFYFMYQDANNFYAFEIDQSTREADNNHSWGITRTLGGVGTTVASGNYTDRFDNDVYYVWRIVSWTSTRGGTDYQKFQVYRDEELIVDTEQLEAFGPTKGKVGVFVYNTTDIAEFSEVSIRSIPSDDTYIGL